MGTGVKRTRLSIVTHASASLSRLTGSEMRAQHSWRKIASSRNASSFFRFNSRMKTTISGGGSSNARIVNAGLSFNPATDSTSILSNALTSSSGIDSGPRTYPGLEQNASTNP
jgi:hypothetical protein